MAGRSLKRQEAKQRIRLLKGTDLCLYIISWCVVGLIPNMG